MSGIGLAVGLGSAALGVGAAGAVGLGVAAGGAALQHKAAGKAVDAQTAASDAAIARQDKSQLALQEALRPYTEGGGAAFTGLLDMMGVGPGGPGAARDAIIDIEGSPQFQAMTRQGEEAILANASATGGLRGGNTKGALAQFRPQVLNQLLEQKFQRLAGASQLGQASAAQVGAGAINTGTNTSNLITNRGEAIGQGYIAQGNTFNKFLGGAGGALTKYIGRNQEINQTGGIPEMTF